jgi:PTH2 family peptidyl-tRNA hydrolase
MFLKEGFSYKQVIVARSDIRMGKGKLAAQVAHAAVGCALDAEKDKPDWFRNWLNEGQAKIVVKVESESRLRELKVVADRLGLPTCLIADRGLTQLEPGTVTCLGVGPGPSDLVDKVTGDLKLY